MAFSGEEEGLLGSNHYVNHPVLPLANTVAMINMDMIGRLRDEKLTIGGVGISITENRMKFKNLLRDPRCSVLVSHVDWWSGFLVFEGKAELTHAGNTDPDTLRRARRHIFSATTRRRSADWDEYDRIANEDKRVAMLLRPTHVYGSALAKMRAALAK